MTPTTLECWIYLLQKAQYKKRSYSQDGDNFNAFRYLELEYWARDRIINKYGENKPEAKSKNGV